MVSENEKEKFLPHNRWYNVRIREQSYWLIVLFHVYNVWSMHQNGEHHANRFEQAGFGGADLMAKSVALITSICVVIIASGKSVNTASSILASVQGVHLVSIPLPFYQHYHVEWVLQAMLVLSALNFVAHHDAKGNNNAIVNGTPSYACFITTKLVPALLIGVYAFKFGRIGLNGAEGYLVGGVLVFWLASFFKSTYEFPLLGLFVGTLLASMNPTEMYADIYFLFVPTVLYVHAASVATFPFKSHPKSE